MEAHVATRCDPLTTERTRKTSGAGGELLVPKCRASIVKCDAIGCRGRLKREAGVEQRG
jgi:hypothetical protein